MPTLLDDVLESHTGPEPRVLTEDVQTVLRNVISPSDDEGSGAAVGLIAHRAKVSTRTVYRCLNPDEAKVTISLDLADRLCIAAGSHLAHCRLVWPPTDEHPSGRITPYVSAETLAAVE